MSMHLSELAEVVQKIVQRDPRYAFEAYEFVFAALTHTQQMLGRVPRAESIADRSAETGGEATRQYHVSGPELMHGVRELALREFGLMARIVLHMWGIDKTDDFGEIVFNLVEANQMSKTDDDTRLDFHNIYDLDEALVRSYKIQLEEAD